METGCNIGLPSRNRVPEAGRRSHATGLYAQIGTRCTLVMHNHSLLKPTHPSNYPPWNITAHPLTGLLGSTLPDPCVQLVLTDMHSIVGADITRAFSTTLPGADRVKLINLLLYAHVVV